MSLASDCVTLGELCCDECHFQKFSSQIEYNLHRLAHKSEPFVALVRLSKYSLGKLEHHSYKVNNGVAKRAVNPVSLKISLKKQHGTSKFQVIKKQKDSEKLKGIDLRPVKGDPENFNEPVKSKTEAAGIKSENRDVEGNKILERCSANNSVRRKNNSSASLQNTGESENGYGDNDNVNKDIAIKTEQEKFLERISIGKGNINIKQKNISLVTDSPVDETILPTILNIFSKTNAENVNHFKGVPEPNLEIKKKKPQKNILKKLSGFGLSLVSKSSSHVDTDRQSKGKDRVEKESKLQRTLVSDGSNLEIFFQAQKLCENAKNGPEGRNPRCEPQFNRDEGKKFGSDRSDSDSSISINDANDSKENRGDLVDSGTTSLKKFARVKNSEVVKKKIDSDKRNQSKELVGLLESNNIELNKIYGVPESILNVSERLTDHLKKPSSNQEGKGKGKKNKKMGINSAPGEQLQQEYIVPQSDRISPGATHSEPQCMIGDEESKLRQDQNDCSTLLDRVDQSQNGDSTFSGVSSSDNFQSETFSAGVADDHNDEVAVAFSSLPNQDQSTLDQPQDSLLTGDGGTNSGDSLNQSFLHNFMNEAQSPQTSIQSESSEYMSLERLGQVSGLENQHSQSNYDLNGNDQSSPMEQLSQQVQRLPNPPQINVIPQHHMQAPQPPQLHSGIPPLSPQQSSSFEGLGHIQPPLPPPLYQGYNLYNQNFSTQGPQQLPPRPPMLQQRPQIQARPFQSIVAPQRQRNRYPVKRNPVRMPNSQEIPQKQRRMEPSVQVRSQPPSMNPAPKIPSGITVIPAKKNLEANKVANVLASRGITVTPSPAVVRQPAPASRLQQQKSSTSAATPPVLNIGPGVSITPNNGSRSGGAFAVPGPRRNSPIVNHNVERPERCTTVDLTQDDDPPTSNRNRGSALRFTCNQCSKAFSTSAALESHKNTHRSPGGLPFKCDKCTAQYPNASGLQQHKSVFHKAKQASPDLAIPIVDLNHPGARDQLAKCGIHSFLPLSQLQSNNLGYFGVPIIQLDAAKEKAISNLNNLGAGNILVLGKMKTLSQPQIR